MTDFPDKFDEAAQPLPIDKLGESAIQATQQLAGKGYEVHAGLTPELASQILIMAREPSIREYCFKDSMERFVDRPATEHWLSRRRGMFTMLRKDAAGKLMLAGYGWTGAGGNSHIPGGTTTFALRIGEAAQGRGLATPFSQLIISGSAVLYGARNFWLETWASNAGAVHIYHKLGFQTVAETPGKRLTRGNGTVADTRIYMSLPNGLLPI